MYSLNCIGNAKLQGLLTQLDLTGQKYNIALVSYLCLSMPMSFLILITGLDRRCTIWCVSIVMYVLLACSGGYKAYLLFNIPAK